MISKKMEKMLNDQINKEYESAHIYRAMAQYFTRKNLSGFQHFYDEQVKEETEHAQKIENYVNEQGGEVVYGAIEAPKSDYNSILEIFETALEHEQKVTKWINDIAKLAREEDDYATAKFIDWFVMEQVEEEDTFGSLVDLLKFLNNDPVSIFLLNEKLGKRNS